MESNVSVSKGHEAPVYHTETLSVFSVWYGDWHGYVCLVICALGIPMNMINITVLTHRKMKTPINCILTWLAVSDIATMISYVPFAVHFYIQHSANSISADKNSWGWMNFLLVYLNFSATAHTISIWLGVALAIFRHYHIQSPAKGNLTRIRRLIRARVVVGVIFGVSIIVMIPYYLGHEFMTMTLPDNSTVYVFRAWNLGSGEEKAIIMVGLILYSTLSKLVPCVLILVYGSLLLVTLKTALRNKRRRMSNGTCVTARSVHDMARTTKMLLIVMILFVITELPQAVLILCCLFLREFFEKVYIPLGDVMDIVALVNSGINFVLYCTMSQEFRQTFIKLFCTRSLNGRRRSSAFTSTQTRHFELQATLTEIPAVPHDI